MIRIFWTFLFLVVLFHVACNTPNSNSNHVDINTERDSVGLWLHWARDSAELSKTQKTDYLKKAFAHIVEHQRNSIQIKNLVKTSYAYLTLRDSINFKKANAVLLEKAKQKDDHESYGLAHWDLAEYYERTKPDSAYYHYRQAHIAFSEAELEDRLRDYPARMLYAMAAIKEKSKDYVGAEKDAIKAIELYKSYGSKKQLFNAYNLLAIIQNGLEKFDKALEYHQKAKIYIEFADDNRHFEFTARNINNIANTIRTSFVQQGVLPF